MTDVIQELKKNMLSLLDIDLNIVSHLPFHCERKKMTYLIDRHRDWDLYLKIRKLVTEFDFLELGETLETNEKETLEIFENIHNPVVVSLDLTKIPELFFHQNDGCWWVKFQHKQKEINIPIIRGVGN